MPRHATSTSFSPGQSGNPRGRTPGTRTKRTIEVRDVCTKLVDDPIYRDALRRRMISGTAGAMEVLVWHYAYGRPVERIETRRANEFAQLTRVELKTRLVAALASFETNRTGD